MQKRIAFTTIAPSDGEPRDTVFGKSNTSGSKEIPKTHRFVLKLEETTNETFPEYSYLDLLRTVEGEGRVDDTDNPFAEQDDNEERKLREIAKKFEAKYGPKRKTYVDIEDYIDKGMGYDENDPFIDNEEAYDELIPSTLTTKYGGFYINCGQLDFKPLCDEDEEENKDDDDFNNKPVMKKRKRDIDSQVPGIKRKRLNNGGKNLNSLIKAKKDKYPQENVSKNNDACVNVFKPKRNIIIDDEEENEDEDSGKSNSKDDDENRQLATGSIDSVIESVVKGDMFPNGSAVLNTSGNSSDGSDGNLNIVQSGQIPKLPDALPSGLCEALDKIKELRLVNAEGKQKFFKDNDVNKVLLEIELKCREMASNHRNQVYAYLGALLPCTKETLMKRAKKLRLENEENKLHLTLAALRDEVAKIMSDLQKQYHESYKSAMSSWERDKLNGRVEEGQEPNIPKKEFRWSEKARSLIKTAVSLKRNLSEVTGVRCHNEEEFLTTFFETEVKPIWPKGWITTKALMDEYQSLISTKTKISDTLCNKVQTNKTCISFIKKPPQVPQQSSMSSSGLVNTSSTGISSSISSQHHRAPVIAAVTVKNDRITTSKNGTNTPVNLSAKDNVEIKQQSTANPTTSKPEGLMCSVDKIITTAISSATLPKPTKTSSPPPNTLNTSVITSNSSKSSNPVVTSQVAFSGQSSRSSPTSLLNKCNYPNSNPSMEKTQTNQRQTKVQQPQQQTQSGTTQQSKQFPGIEYAFEHEISKFLSEGKNSQSSRQETKTVQKQVQQTQQSGAATSRSSPVSPFQRMSSSSSVKQTQLSSTNKQADSKPMVTITPIPHTQHTQHHQMSRGSMQQSSYSSQSPSITTATTTPTQNNLYAQFLFAQNFPFVNYSMLLSANQGAVTTNSASTTNSSHQYANAAAFNLMHHHTYAAPPPPSGGTCD
ncbi:Ubinuclein-2-like protein [Dinothrombium tinctorium]|uniref:Ubinuclein-2-like protein n=1 Tax=Dinothrombium tinctorium TaxID=1965070 RepID=A0A3S3RWP7_9ACAR|nr:Ubinuclein-2-like protein [Dinothrombium tinctorium]RWS07140.1 Ubinuclein-2-like protein [Dinothrombium tinctorium]RWS08146.1 Ubinuclein-2-like protein [Dinothrombium tinctorium]